MSKATGGRNKRKGERRKEKGMGGKLEKIE